MTDYSITFTYMLMLTTPQRDLVRDKGTLLGRVLMGLLFFVTGLVMLSSPSAAASYIGSYGVPLASLIVWPIMLLKIAAGGAVILGKRVGLAAATLVLYTAAATIVVNEGLGMTDFLFNLSVIGGLLYLMSYGPGGSNTKLETPAEASESN